MSNVLSLVPGSVEFSVCICGVYVVINICKVKLTFYHKGNNDTSPIAVSSGSDRKFYLMYYLTLHNTSV